MRLQALSGGFALLLLAGVITSSGCGSMNSSTNPAAAQTAGSSGGAGGSGGNGNGGGGNATPSAVMIVPEGNSSNGEGSDILSFRIGEKAGTFIQAGSASYLNCPGPIVAHPAGNIFYVGAAGTTDTPDFNVQGFKVKPDGSMFGPIADFETGSAVLAMAMHPSGTFMYVYAVNSGLSVLHINSDYSISSVQSLQLNETLEDLSVSADGNFLFFGIGGFGVGTNGIYEYRINSSTGELSPAVGSPFMAGTAFGLVVPAANRIYANSANALYGFTVDPTSGALSPVQGSPFSVVAALASSDEQGMFLFGGGFSSQTNYVPQLWVYKIDQASGAISLVADAPAGTQWTGSQGVAGTYAQTVAYDEVGNFLYLPNAAVFAVNVTNNNVGSFSFDRITSALHALPGSPFEIGNEGEGPMGAIILHPH